MSDLDDEARSLFDTARGAYEPSAADHQRVLNSVLTRAGVVVAVAEHVEPELGVNVPTIEVPAAKTGLPATS